MRFAVYHSRFLLAFPNSHRVLPSIPPTWVVVVDDCFAVGKITRRSRDPEANAICCFPFRLLSGSSDSHQVLSGIPPMWVAVLDDRADEGDGLTGVLLAMQMRVAV